MPRIVGVFLMALLAVISTLLLENYAAGMSARHAFNLGLSWMAVLLTQAGRWYGRASRRP